MPFLTTVRCIAKVLAERWRHILKPHRAAQESDLSASKVDESVLPHAHGASWRLKITDFDKIERRE
jgi:hypothetical protein